MATTAITTDHSDSFAICGFEDDPLAEKISAILEKTLIPVQQGSFNDTSSNIKIDIPDRSAFEGKNVILIAGNCRKGDQSINDTTMDIFLTIEAAKRAGGRVKLYMPHLGYARQDKISQAGEPLAAQKVLQMFELAGAEKITVLDIHNPEAFNLLKIGSLNRFAMEVFASKFKEMQDSGTKLNNLVVVAPDKGAIERAKLFRTALKAADFTEVAFAFFDKSRDTSQKGTVRTMDLREYECPDESVLTGKDAQQEFSGKTVVVVDDMADTSGTLLRAISDNMVGRYGASEAYAAITHGVFSGDALDKIGRTKELTKIFVTDSVPLREKPPANLEVLCCASVFAETIRAGFPK